MLMNMKRDALDERKVSFKVESEISERDDEDEEIIDEPTHHDQNDLEGLSGAEKGSNSHKGHQNHP